MKLTKSQRLFVKVGRIEYHIDHLKSFYKHDKLTGAMLECYAHRMKELKEKRKKLIREAVMAANDELDEAWHEGLSVGVDWTI